MKKFVLNSAVLTAFGAWDYTRIRPEDARAWMMRCVCDHSSGQVDGETCRACRGSGQPWTSTIGYAETAAALEALLGLPEGAIPVNRVQIAMDPGDEALVFRLVLPAGSPRINPQDKGAIRDMVTAGHWELGLLTRQR